MPINVVRDRQGRQRFQFEFSRRLGAGRVRKRRLLPAGWTRSEADAFDRKESGALYALATGVTKPRWHIDEAVARYLAERAPELKHGGTVRRELEQWREWWAGRFIDELPKVCAEYAADQADALKPATIKNRISYLRAACRWVWKRHGMADSDPGARVVVPTVRNAREVVVSRDQVEQLAKACEHAGVRALIRRLFYSGMRVAEAQRAQVVGGAFVLRDTKNGSPRVVPVHPALRRDAKVPMPPRSEIDYWWPKARKACGLEHVTLHDLRHSAASAMINAGEDLATVGAVLGHKSAASTKRYSHWATERLAAAVGKIGGRRKG